MGSRAPTCQVYSWELHFVVLSSALSCELLSRFAEEADGVQGSYKRLIHPQERAVRRLAGKEVGGRWQLIFDAHLRLWLYTYVSLSHHYGSHFRGEETKAKERKPRSHTGKGGALSQHWRPPPVSCCNASGGGEKA